MDVKLYICIFMYIGIEEYGRQIIYIEEHGCQIKLYMYIYIYGPLSF